MSKSDETPSQNQSRRGFLKTSAAAVGAAVGTATIAGLPKAAEAAPKRGGILRFATRSDARGLDPHKNLTYNVSHPLAATTQGLL
ncbi:MAG: twin-arginine translocation signal domain-containing protein, partial [Alphaproteobacteria bacterium]|nr:twin-arginine translocation signal domain-containing protein [Alphaproteobacteria bacterium]